MINDIILYRFQKWKIFCREGKLHVVIRDTHDRRGRGRVKKLVSGIPLLDPDWDEFAIYDLFGAEKKTLRPVGEWNESRIIVNGNHIEHWLNGSKVAETDLGSDTLREAIAKSKFHVVPGFGTKIATPLCLQDHGEEVSFRNLKIRELHPQ